MQNIAVVGYADVVWGCVYNIKSTPDRNECRAACTVGVKELCGRERPGAMKGDEYQIDVIIGYTHCIFGVINIIVCCTKPSPHQFVTNAWTVGVQEDIIKAESLHTNTNIV